MIVRLTQILYKAQKTWNVSRCLDIPVNYCTGENTVVIYPPFTYSNRYQKELSAQMIDAPMQERNSFLRVHEAWENFPFIISGNQISSIMNPKPCWVTSKFHGYLPMPPVTDGDRAQAPEYAIEPQGRCPI